MALDVPVPRPRSVLAAGAAAATAAAVLVPTAGPASATEADITPHCVIQIEGILDTGEFVTAEPVCFGTLAEALATAGLDVDPAARIDVADVVADELVAAAAASGPIGIHYDGFNTTGASITVTGSDCAGGYLNLSATWINRISSTINFCPVVRFFDGFDKSGASEATTPAQTNLSPLNNASNSIQYASS